MQVTGLGNGNKIVGAPAQENRCRVSFHGRNANLIIHPGCNLDDAHFRLFDNAVIEVGASSTYSGTILAQVNCRVSLGSRLQCNSHLNISCAEETQVRVGERCLVSSGTIRSSDMHPIFDAETGERINFGADVTIGDDVWFAQGAFVLKGVNVGAGSVIAAMTVVTRDVPARSIVAGNPGKVIREGIRWHPRLPLRKPVPAQKPASGTGT